MTGWPYFLPEQISLKQLFQQRLWDHLSHPNEGYPTTKGSHLLHLPLDASYLKSEQTIVWSYSKTALKCHFYNFVKWRRKVAQNEPSKIVWQILGDPYFGAHFFIIWQTCVGAVTTATKFFFYQSSWITYIQIDWPTQAISELSYQSWLVKQYNSTKRTKYDLEWCKQQWYQK